MFFVSLYPAGIAILDEHNISTPFKKHPPMHARGTLLDKRGRTVREQEKEKGEGEGRRRREKERKAKEK